MVVGIVLAPVITRPLASSGFVPSTPVGTLVFLLVLGGTAGVLAAVVPARHAARVDILEAIATR